MEASGYAVSGDHMREYVGLHAVHLSGEGAPRVARCEGDGEREGSQRGRELPTPFSAPTFNGCFFFFALMLLFVETGGAVPSATVRRPRSVLCAVSLLLCAAFIIAWVASYRSGHRIEYLTLRRTAEDVAIAHAWSADVYQGGAYLQYSSYAWADLSSDAGPGWAYLAFDSPLQVSSYGPTRAERFGFGFDDMTFGDRDRLVVLQFPLWLPALLAAVGPLVRLCIWAWRRRRLTPAGFPIDPPA